MTNDTKPAKRQALLSYLIQGGTVTKLPDENSYHRTGGTSVDNHTVTWLLKHELIEISELGDSVNGPGYKKLHVTDAGRTAFLQTEAESAALAPDAAPTEPAPDSATAPDLLALTSDLMTARHFLERQVEELTTDLTLTRAALDAALAENAKLKDVMNKVAVAVRETTLVDSVPDAIADECFSLGADLMRAAVGKSTRFDRDGAS